MSSFSVRGLAIVGSVVFASTMIAGWVGGEKAFLQASAAWLIAGAPTLASLYLAKWALPKGHQWLAAAVLGGTFGRMAIALALGGALVILVPRLGGKAFWLWLVGAYLASLTLEVVTLVRLMPTPSFGSSLSGREKQGPR